jgi:hypothetical protein
MSRDLHYVWRLHWQKFFVRAQNIIAFYHYILTSTNVVQLLTYNFIECHQTGTLLYFA